MIVILYGSMLKREPERWLTVPDDRIIPDTLAVQSSWISSKTKKEVVKCRVINKPSRPWAPQIGATILAIVRNRVADIATRIGADNIARIQVDSIAAVGAAHVLETIAKQKQRISPEIGQWKIEHTGRLEIKNMTTLRWSDGTAMGRW